MNTYKRFRWDVRPKALEENTVCGSNWRFTVLTPNLIRMEYAPSGAFEDRASQKVWFRDLGPVSYTKETNGATTIIQTSWQRYII